MAARGGARSTKPDARGTTNITRRKCIRAMVNGGNRVAEAVAFDGVDTAVIVRTTAAPFAFRRASAELMVLAENQSPADVKWPAIVGLTVDLVTDGLLDSEVSAVVDLMFEHGAIAVIEYDVIKGELIKRRQHRAGDRRRSRSECALDAQGGVL